MAGALEARAWEERVTVDAAHRPSAPVIAVDEIGTVVDRRSAPRGEDSNRRRAPRRRVLIAGLLETPSGAIDVKLRNVSGTGALLETRAPPAENTRVTFKRGNMVVHGLVVWSGGGACGIHFDRPIDETELMIPIGKPAGAR